MILGGISPALPHKPIQDIFEQKKFRYFAYLCSNWELLLAWDASGGWVLDFVAHAEHDDGYEKAENANQR